MLEQQLQILGINVTLFSDFGCVCEKLCKPLILKKENIFDTH